MDTGRVNPDTLRDYLVELISATRLNGLKPEDGDKYGVDGSPQSWADYMVALAKVESSYKVKDKGDVGLFPGDSNGLFQLSPNDATQYGIQDDPFSMEQLQDPSVNAYIAVLIHENLALRYNSIRNGIGKYWGPVRRGWTP